MISDKNRLTFDSSQYDARRSKGALLQPVFGWPGVFCFFTQGSDLYSGAAREYKSFRDGLTQLIHFWEWISHVPPQVNQYIRTMIDHTEKSGFDGIDMHEAWNFQTNLVNMALLNFASLRLQKLPMATP